MKHTIGSLIALILTTAVLAACQPKDDGGGDGGTQATTPAQNCNIPGTASGQCNPQNYQTLGNGSFISYQWAYSGGFCGCPAGYRPVMNTQWGISCAPQTFFGNNYAGGSYGSNYAGYTYTSVVSYAQNGQWTSIPQITYSPAVSGTGNNCYASAASACDTRNANSCGNGGTCRATSGGSYIGLCTNGVGADTYGQPVNCWYRSYNGWVNRCQQGGSYNGVPFGAYGGGFNGGFGASAGGNIIVR